MIASLPLLSTRGALELRLHVILSPDHRQHSWLALVGESLLFHVYTDTVEEGGKFEDIQLLLYSLAFPIIVCGFNWVGKGGQLQHSCKRGRPELRLYSLL